MTDLSTSTKLQSQLTSDHDESNIKLDGSLEFVREYGGNLSKPSYQEASGAPVENISPLGLQVTSFTAMFLNISGMVGTGIFSTPATILTEVGSVGLSLVFWALGFIVACCELSVFLELASYFPNRSGAAVVYLEQSYPRPKYLIPIAVAVQSVLLNFGSAGAIVIAEYLYAVASHTPSAWELKGLACASMTFVVLLVVFSTKWSFLIVKVVGIFKLSTLIFISITGLVVLGGHTGVPHPKANFQDAFRGTVGNGYSFSNALVKVNFAYAGYTTAFTFVNEIKNPVNTLKRVAPASLLIVATLYMLCNIAYFAAVPASSLKTSKQLAAALFFSSVFGAHTSRILNLLIALSALGNLTSGIIGSSRITRECGRQGILPYPSLWASTKPFGTPFAAYLLKYLLTVLMILAPPAGDAFNFVLDLQSYPGNVFSFATTFGLLLIRRRRKRLGILVSTEFRAWNVAIAFSLAVNIFILAMPWVPPPGGRFGGDVSFWYATYCVVGLAILGLCGVYYIFWIHVGPRFGQYQIRQEVLVLGNEGAKVHRLVKVPLAESQAWDAEHDALGQRVENSPGSESVSVDATHAGEKDEEKET